MSQLIKLMFYRHESRFSFPHWTSMKDSISRWSHYEFQQILMFVFVLLSVQLIAGMYGIPTQTQSCMQALMHSHTHTHACTNTHTVEINFFQGVKMWPVTVSVRQMRMAESKTTDKKIADSINGEPIIIEQEDEVRSAPRCLGLRRACHSCTRPVRTKYNPLPREPTLGQRFKHGIMCPPHGNLSKYIFFIVLFLMAWAVLISLTGAGGLPRGNFFSLCVLFFACIVGGYLVAFIRLPPLLGKSTNFDFAIP